MAVWNEADHPRDEEGKFTEKGSGSSAKDSSNVNKEKTVLYGGVEKNEIKRDGIKSRIENIKDKIISKELKEKNKNEKRAAILYPNMPDNKKIQELKNIGEKEFSDIEKERILNHTKNIGLAALEIGSALIPFSGEAKLAAGITKALEPKIGRAIAKEVGKGAARGTYSGGVTGSIKGLGEGLENDKNLIATTLEGGLTGAALGGISGAGIGIASGKGIQMYKGLKLKDFKPIDNMTKEERKEFRKFAKEYYQDYLQDTKIKNNEIGNIDFTGQGLKEVLRWNPKQAKNFPILKNDIKHSKEINFESQKHNRKDTITHFEVIKGENGFYIIAVSKDGNKKYYFSRDIPR